MFCARAKARASKVVRAQATRACASKGAHERAESTRVERQSCFRRGVRMHRMMRTNAPRHEPRKGNMSKVATSASSAYERRDGNLDKRNASRGFVSVGCVRTRRGITLERGGYRGGARKCPLAKAGRIRADRDRNTSSKESVSRLRAQHPRHAIVPIHDPRKGSVCGLGRKHDARANRAETRTPKGEQVEGTRSQGDSDARAAPQGASPSIQSCDERCRETCLERGSELGGGRRNERCRRTCRNMNLERDHVARAGGSKGSFGRAA